MWHSDLSWCPRLDAASPPQLQSYAKEHRLTINNHHLYQCSHSPTVTSAALHITIPQQYQTSFPLKRLHCFLSVFLEEIFFHNILLDFYFIHFLQFPNLQSLVVTAYIKSVIHKQLLTSGK